MHDPEAQALPLALLPLETSHPWLPLLGSPHRHLTGVLVLVVVSPEAAPEQEKQPLVGPVPSGPLGC